jgi:hypothetical protein
LKALKQEPQAGECRAGDECGPVAGHAREADRDGHAGRCERDPHAEQRAQRARASFAVAGRELAHADGGEPGLGQAAD